MYHGHLEGNMPHTLAANHLLGHLYAASVASNSTVLIAFVLTTMAFVIFYRTKDTLTVESITLGLERAVSAKRQAPTVVQPTTPFVEAARGR